MDQKSHIRNWIYLGIFTVALFLIVIFLSVFNSIPQNNQTEEEIDYELFDTIQNFEILPVENNKLIVGNGISLELPQNYFVSTIANGAPAGTECKGFEGETALKCRTYYVRENNDNAKEVYFSYPNNLIFDVLYETKTENKTISFGNQEIRLFYMRKVLIDDEGEIQEEEGNQVYSQIYGCVDTKICVNAGFLSQDPQENAQQVLKFENLLKNLQIK